MSNLLDFLFNTIRARAIDPSNPKFFLPTVLSGLSGDNSQGKLLPIEERSWQIGPITGSEGQVIATNFANNWATYLQKKEHIDLSSQYPIADPADPNPQLILGNERSNVVIDGLQNVYVLPEHDITQIPEGYRAKIVLKFDHWDGQEGRPTITRLGISGPYQLSQSLCVANNGSNTCNGVASTNIVGIGTVGLSIDDIFIDAITKISVGTDARNQRAAQITIESLTVRGLDPATPPSIGITTLTIDASVSPFYKQMLVTAATNAIQSPDGQAGIIANLNAALNQPSNLAAISATMTQNLARLIDGFIGQTPASMPAAGPAGLNPIDGYLFDRARCGLDDPASEMFLPTILASSRNPSLNPLQVASISLPDITALVQFQNNSLAQVVVSGLVNVKAAPETLVFARDTLQFSGSVGGWNPPPAVPSGLQIPAPPARADAQFAMTPVGSSAALSGGLQLTIRSAKLSGICHFSGSTDTDLTVDFRAMQVVIGDLVNDLRVEIIVDSQFKTFINQAVNSPAVLGRIISEVNGQLASHLGDIGTEVTKYIRQAIAGALK